MAPQIHSSLPAHRDEWKGLATSAVLFGCSIFDVPLSTIPDSSLPVLLGALRIAVSTKDVRIIGQPLRSPSLTMTPIFAASSFTYLVIEVIR